MAQLGMDVEAVESVGRQLKQSATSVDQIVGGLDKTVNGLLQLWEGPDAQRFVQSWPTFRKSLIAAQASVAGLGQSALNNASEQRDASGVKGSGGNDGATALARPTVSSLAPSASPTHNPQPGFDVSAEQHGYNNRDPHTVPAYFMPGGNGDGQCTSWVNYRRQELVNEHLLPASALVPIAWNPKHSQFYTGSVTTTPTQYAVGSMDGVHTFVVESVTDGSPRTITISEMNYGKAPDSSRPDITTGLGTVHAGTYEEVGAGVWKRPGGATHHLNFGA